MNAVEVLVPNHVTESVTATFGIYFERINGVDRRILGRDHTNPARYLENLHALNSVVPLKGKKVLEIGAGYGISLALLLKRFEADAIGVEPASLGFENSFNGARDILAANHLDCSRVVDACGENLPFSAATFDVIYSNNVLEHTDEPARVLREAARVLKPGGTLYLEVPNYLSYFEGHYLVPQPPIVLRGMLPLWIKWVCRRDEKFARTLRSEINPVWLRKRFDEINQEYPIEIHTMGEERFLARLAQPFSFQTDAVRGVASKGMRFVQAVNWKNWLGRLIVKLKGHYPIVLVATRRSS